MKIFTGFILLATILGSFAALQAKPYKGAELRTNQPFTYGRFEVRLKSAAGSGLLSSFFTYYDGTGLPANWNEIDIEIMGRYNNEAQFNTITPGQVNHPYRDTLQYNPHQSFHVYAIEWTPDYVAWFVDGFETYRQTGSHIPTLFRPQKNMMNIWQPESVEWAGPFNPAILPVYAYYDWVKNYSYTPGVGDNFTLQWSDDFDNWNTSRWSKGNHTWVGNNSDLIPENAVFFNGYLVLCLTAANAIGYNGSPVIDLDNQPPYLVWARSYENKLLVFFSEEVETASAQTASNYIVPGLAVGLATLQPDNRSVELAVPNIDLAVAYNLIASGIKDRAPSPNAMPLQITIVKTPLPSPAKLNVGGNAWNGYLKDQVWDYSREYGSTGGAAILNPGLPIGGTDEDEVYQSELRNITFYQARLDRGVYNLTLMFAETQHNAAGQRVFDVAAEGQQVLDNLDIFAASGMNAALEKQINNLSVNDGMLNLYFRAETGETVLSGLRIERVPTGLAPGGSQFVPGDFQLDIFPNPFNPATTIRYRLPRSGRVDVEIYNITGQMIEKPVSGFQAAGLHAIRFEANGLPGGIYICRVSLDGAPQAARKLVLIR
ncbi:MAG: family 16 glycosylhydrolase [Calditrichaceae bacterium]|nr:family 16 glycosylhydrolase [Calditrichia bacterium]NUQ41592.1 family 16 glycosylhydrolase [Calditrichaceae bacterium]